MLCLKKRRTYSFTHGTESSSAAKTKRRQRSASKDDEQRTSTLPRNHHGAREERSSAMVLTVTEDTPADMLAGSMELLVQIPREHHVQTQRVTVQRSTPMMDLLVQIATAHKLAASSYTLQAIGERGLVLTHQPNTPIGALDALQVKLLPKQGTLLPRVKGRPASQPFETTFRLQVHLPRNQLYVSRVSPKTNLGEILDEVCREKNLDRNKYELRHPAHLSETLDLSLTLQDYHLQEVTLFPRQQARTNVSSGLSSQDIMALQKQEEHRRNQARQGVFGFMFKNKTKETSLSTDSLGNRSVSPARSDETDACNKQTMPAPSALPSRPLRKRRPAPKPPTMQKETKEQKTSESKSQTKQSTTTTTSGDKDKIVISHSRNSSDSSGYHEASVLSDNPDNSNGGRMPETLPRRGRMQGILEAPRKLAQTSHASKSLGNLAIATSQGGTLSRGISNTSLSSNGQRKKRAAPPPPMARPLPSAISAQGLERIVDSDESLTSDMDLSKPSSDIDAAATGSSQASSDIACHIQPHPVESARVVKKEAPVPRPRKVLQAGTLSTEPSSSRASPLASPSPSTSSIPASPSFGLPSLTEDEEIALAIDSIVQASRGHVDDSPESSLEIRCEVVEEVKLAAPIEEKIVVEDESEAKETEKTEEKIKDVEVPKEPSVSNRNDSVINVDVHVDPEEPESEKDVEKARAVSDQTKVTKHETESKVKFELGETSTKAPSCAIISTIPKCDHLEPFADGDNFSAKKRGNRVVRSQSETGHFEVGPAEKHSRHLTTNGEAFTFALNPNLGGDAARRIIEASGSVTTDTDILLQKVSDTLTISALAPPSPPPTPEDLRSLEVPPQLDSGHSVTKDRLDDRPNQDKILDRSHTDIVKESNSQPREEGKCRPEEYAGSASNSSESSSANNSTTQQDTSDYVSASGEELSSITDWEYQIPAPPSAFRDDEDTESTPPKPIKESISIEAEVHQVQPKKPTKLSSTTYIELQQPLPPEPKSTPVDSVDFSQPKVSKLATQTSTEQLKKAEVISELENKISNNKPVVVEAPRTDETDAPKIAPVENNLANFTITTYSRQKSLDIFEPMDQQQQEETRVLNTFATLSRGRSLASDYAEEKMGKIGPLKNAISMERINTGHLVDDKVKFADRTEALREKPVHRSKSYIILSSNEKFQNKANEIEKNRDEKVDERVDYKVNESSKKMTSLVNLNTGTKDEVLNHKEKFSQWRENMLRKHEEPSPEKQLQSLQVLKSILPQLKNAQATAENNYKITSDRFITKKRQEFQPEVMEPPSLPSEVKLRSTANRRIQDAAKRYTYCGPPSISLGSWSERPSLNVQIKTDTDYKFGGSSGTNGNSSSISSGARTFINLNGGGIDKEDEKIGFRKTIKEEKKDDEPRVDTSSVAFKDLTKAFGQEVRLRPKPVSTARIPQNRHSEYLERPKQNGFSDSQVTTTNNVGLNQNRKTGPAPPVKRYTSVVGITNNNNVNDNNSINMNKNVLNGSMQQNNFRFTSDQNKPAQALVVKSFNGQEKEYAVPKPPTMPIITGVTLKSVNARQKSNPPMTQQDPRDQLLESIRNFGGRGNLKKATDKY